jgi:outer membrane protein OmpU
MKHTLLTSTALVGLATAASADFTISGSARIGLMSTEGTAAKTTAAAAAALTAAQTDTALYFMGGTAGFSAYGKAGYGLAASATTWSAGAAFTAGELNDSAFQMVTDLATVVTSIKAAQAADTSAAGSTAAGQFVTDLATAEGLLAAARGSAASTTAAVADKTSAVNRMRVTFTGSGETDGGISFGATMRADNAGTAASSGGMAGSQHVSGAFGKITMGDLGGADKDATGNIAGVGLTGLGDHNEVSYQAAAGHNLGYSYSVSGLTFGYSQDTSVTTGSNSAMGVKYSGDIGGATVALGVGQSKVGDSTQSTMSVSASSGGLTLKAISSTNDNGPADDAVTERKQTGVTAATQYRAAVAAAANADTDTTGVSVSYSMDAMSVTAFTKTVSTSGSADMDYSGFGFSYNMGGVSLKAGVVDNNDQQLLDFGMSFSF